jgi:pimeloyl-ACP methyl ester carboxylesterase
MRSLILACTACHTDPWRQELLERWAVEAETLGPRRFLLANLGWLSTGYCGRWLWSLYARLAPLPFAPSAQGFVGQVNACLNAADYRPALATISVPTLVVAGERDRLTPVDDSVELAGLIPGAEFAVIPGAGQLFPIERSATFNRMLLRFLDRCPRWEPYSAGGSDRSTS